jgi:RNA ligase
MEKIDIELLKKYHQDKWISVQKHPFAYLWIYNYTKECEYAKHWDEITSQCRGLIVDIEGNIVSRPFRKFFNYEEYILNNSLPNEHYSITEKYDGSLGISYWIGDQIYLATRGSFVSEQAAWGSWMIRTLHKDYKFNRNYTYLFEIIYPENKIVVDYHGEDKLVLLAVIATETGEELNLAQFSGEFEIAKSYNLAVDFKSLKARNEPNKEGFVIRYDSGLRLKLKFDEYVRLHRLLTNTNTKQIWEHFKSGHKLSELTERVPPEFEQWVMSIALDLTLAYKNIELDAKMMYDTAIKVLSVDNHTFSRKEFAEVAKRYVYPALFFAMYDSKPYDKIIWDLIKPETAVPFKHEVQ